MARKAATWLLWACLLGCLIAQIDQAEASGWNRFTGKLRSDPYPTLPCPIVPVCGCTLHQFISIRLWHPLLIAAQLPRLVTNAAAAAGLQRLPLYLYLSVPHLSLSLCVSVSLSCESESKSRLIVSRFCNNDASDQLICTNILI